MPITSQPTHGTSICRRQRPRSDTPARKASFLASLRISRTRWQRKSWLKSNFFGFFIFFKSVRYQNSLKISRFEQHNAKSRVQNHSKDQTNKGCGDIGAKRKVPSSCFQRGFAQDIFSFVPEQGRAITWCVSDGVKEVSSTPVINIGVYLKY